MYTHGPKLSRHDALPLWCQPAEREQPLALRRLQGIEREEEQPEQQPKIRIERPADRDERTVHSSAHRKGQTANDPMGVGCDGVPVDLVAASGQRTRPGHDARLALLSNRSYRTTNLLQGMVCPALPPVHRKLDTA